tara:strand:- start:469 stop:768 length:300 start_codon:yes stop_codon:yes gene_type:complete
VFAWGGREDGAGGIWKGVASFPKAFLIAEGGGPTSLRPLGNAGIVPSSRPKYFTLEIPREYQEIFLMMCSIAPGVKDLAVARRIDIFVVFGCYSLVCCY